MTVFGWHVLCLVFLYELLAMTAWFLVASPKARYGGSVARPVAKVLVFGLASLALWDAGHAGWALALLVFSVVVNAVAQLPSVQALASDAERRG